jgi:hypothetical protein
VDLIVASTVMADVTVDTALTLTALIIAAGGFLPGPVGVSATLTTATGWASGDAIRITVDGELDGVSDIETFDIAEPAVFGQTTRVFDKINSVSYRKLTGTLSAEAISVGIGDATPSTEDVRIGLPFHAGSIDGLKALIDLGGVTYAISALSDDGSSILVAGKNTTAWERMRLHHIGKPERY